MFYFDSVVVNVAVFGAALVVGFAVRLLLFLASWALADLPDTPLRQLVLPVTSAWALTYAAVLAGTPLVLLLAASFGMGLGGFFALHLVLIGSVSAGLAAAVYIPWLGLRPAKGAQVAGVEVLLSWLLAALVIAAVFLVLAVVQVASRADAGPPTPAAPTALARPWSATP
jgi:hypothetical protein